MRNTAINSLRYTGIVTVSQCIGSKKIELVKYNNTGSTTLFNFITDCLLGDFETAKANRPTKIMLLEYVQTDANNQQLEEPYHKSKSGFIYLLNKPEKVYDDVNGIVRYSFKITRDMREGTSFDSIGLYANSTDDIHLENWAAMVHGVKLNGLGTSQTSSALIIDWELHITNNNPQTSAGSNTKGGIK